MAALVAILVGVLYAGGVYMMLRRSLVKLIVGLILLAHAANLLIFTAAGLTRGRPPLVRQGEEELAAQAADPLPQALVLTAIVIGFAVTALFLVVLLASRGLTGTDHVDGREPSE